MLYLGCPQWSSNHWRANVFTHNCKPSDMLNQYAEIFNSVEGNTSFYADPSRDTLLRWRAQVNDDFRFTFKIPQRISHQSGLLNYQTDLAHWLTLFEPILEQTGNIMLQLPSSFSPEMLARLDSFIRAWPSALPLSVEVRNLGFFSKRRY